MFKFSSLIRALGLSIAKRSFLKLAALIIASASLILLLIHPSPGQVNLPQRINVLSQVPATPQVTLPITPPRQRGDALDIQVNPPNPQLGDTIAVTIGTFANPTVSLEGKIYPAFPRGNNIWVALLPTTPLDTPGTKSLLISAESEVRQISLPLADRSFPTQRIWLPGGDDNEPTDDYEFDRVAEFKALVTPEKYWQGTLLRPTSGGLTTGYGVRRYYNGVFAEDYFHRGLDYGADTGEPVIAPAAGRISLVGRANQRFNVHGNTVGIDHGQGLSSIMLHLSRIEVQEGDFVEAGQVVGRVGATGAVTGPHLHWGLFVHGLSIDPVPWREGKFAG